MGVLVPQITEDGLPFVPQEREQNRTLDKDCECPCASDHGGRVAGLTT